VAREEEATADATSVSARSETRRSCLDLHERAGVEVDGPGNGEGSGDVSLVAEPALHAQLDVNGGGTQLEAVWPANGSKLEEDAPKECRIAKYADHLGVASDERFEVVFAFGPI
jgi:hypothetical protein